MKFSKIALLSTAFAAAFVAGSASPSARATLDVYAPPITSPSLGTVWTVGETRNITWDVSNPPPQISNPTGLIYLRSGDYTTPLILAKNFNISLGIISTIVPDVREAKDYSIVLIGDSGNFSPCFAITGSGVYY